MTVAEARYYDIMGGVPVLITFTYVLLTRLRHYPQYYQYQHEHVYLAQLMVPNSLLLHSGHDV